MHPIQAFPSLKVLYVLWQLVHQPLSLNLGRRPQMSPGHNAILLSIIINHKNPVTSPTNISLINFCITFATLDRIFNLWNITSPQLNLSFSSSWKATLTLENFDDNCLVIQLKQSEKRLCCECVGLSCFANVSQRCSVCIATTAIWIRCDQGRIRCECGVALLQIYYDCSAT